MKFNWKYIGTAIFTLLSMLSVAAYSLGDVATIIPPKWKANLFILSSMAAFILKVWDAKKPQPPTQ